MADPGGGMDGWLSVLSAGLLVRVTVVLGTTWVVTFLLRRRAASHRHIVWTAGVLAACALPLLSWKLPEVRAPLPEQVSEIFRTSLLETDVIRGSTREREPDRPGRAPTNEVGEEQRRSASPLPEPDGTSADPGLRPDGGVAGSFLPGVPLKRVLTWIWLAGSGLLTLLWLRERWIWQRLKLAADAPSADAIVRAASEAAEAIGFHRGFQVLVSDEVDVPVTWGTGSPVVLLPTHASSWPARRLLSVFAHELAHARRRDHLARQVAVACVAIYWFHPLAWLAAHRAHVESEHACDDEVVLSGVDRFDYAEDLIVLARGFAGRTVPRYAATAARNGSQLRGRIHALVDSGQRRDRIRPLKAGVPVLSAGTVACLLAVLEPTVPDAVPVVSAESRSSVQAQRVLDHEALATPQRSPPGLLLRGGSECWRPERTANHNSNRNEEAGEWFLVWTSPACRSRITVTGTLVASSDFRRLVRLTPGARLEIIEHERGQDIALRVRRGPQGSPVVELRIDGRSVDRLASAHRAWLRERLAFLHDETDGSAVVVAP